MKAADALEAAKRLHAVVGRLAERRERHVLKATGEFQLDLLAAISEAPDEILEMVTRAVAMDPGQAYLQLALSIAVDERNDRRGLRRAGRTGDTERSRVDHHEAETERPPSYETFELEGDAGALDDLPAPQPSPMDGDDAPGRYPEPGEPATLLPDGTVVALGATA
jgi:hypothetical protein